MERLIVLRKSIKSKLNNNRILRKAAVITAVFLTFLLCITAISALTGETASARVTQTQINRLRNEKREYERQKREIQEKINTIEFERLAELEKKEVLDRRIALTSREIANTNELIHQFSMFIREKEYELVIAQNREEAQLQRYRDRVRDMEENGIISYLEIIFDSTSFADFLARVDFVRDIMRSDENTYISLQNARDDTEDAKTALEETKAELDAEKEQLELMEIELGEQLEEAHAIILRMEADIETENELYEQMLAEEERVQREINAAVAALRRQQEAERLRREREARQAQSSSGGGGNTGGGNTGGGGSVIGTGELMWPMSGPVISRFGPRNGRIHQGIDIGAAHGANVIAADSGTVITSRHTGGYGEYIVICHGNGMTTLYAHLSSRLVERGATVTKGQVIGLNGSSGNATCPHLHFEVSVNGVRVDPLTRL